MRRWLNRTWIAGLVLAGAGLLATTASAQMRFVGSFTLPCRASWAGAVLPAGDYTMRLESLSKGTYIQVDAVNGNTRAYVPQWSAGDKSSDENVILLTVIGTRCVVRALNLADLGMEITYPLSREERQELARQGSQRERLMALGVTKH
jgi:hypothetical protein